MAKTYEDLSRRALIQLGHDYDDNNDGALLQYLTEHSDEYEKIRPVEAIINRMDQAVSTISKSGYKIKKTIGIEGGNIVEKAIDTVSDVADIISDSLDNMAATSEA